MRDVLERNEVVVTVKSVKTLTEYTSSVRDIMERSNRQLERGEAIVWLGEGDT